MTTQTTQRTTHLKDVRVRALTARALTARALLTVRALTALPRRPLLERTLTRAAGAALSATAYLLCLPWDLRNRPSSPGAIDETTPVTNTGVALLVLSLAALAAYFGYRDRMAWALLLVAVPSATLLYVSFDTHPTPDAGAWPLAWAFFTLVLGVGVLVAGGLARLFRPTPRG